MENFGIATDGYSLRLIITLQTMDEEDDEVAFLNHRKTIFSSVIWC